VAAQYDYTIAIKQKEIIGPNLPMIFGLAAVDGFDGGILPLADYIQFTQLLLPPEAVTTDGRLREQLTAVPPAQWLDLINSRYIITDKVGDSWRGGVFFDRQHPQSLATETDIGFVPNFAADQLLLLADGQPGFVEILLADGRQVLEQPVEIEDGLFRVFIDVNPTIIEEIVVQPKVGVETAPTFSRGQAVLQAITLLNTVDDTFQPLALGNYRLIYSGDVKIYENLDVLPRAFLLPSWTWQPDLPSVLTAMQQPDYVVGETAVLLGNGQNDSGNIDNSATATIIEYAPERVVVQTVSSQAQLLLLSDAYYAGWQVTVDGASAELLQADGLFRGVLLPAGAHEVVFTFVPQSYRLGLLLTAVGLGLLLFLLVALLILHQLDAKRGENIMR